MTARVARRASEGRRRRARATAPPGLRVVVVTLGLLVACAPPAPERYAQEQARATPPAVHAVHAERLRELMRGLDALTRERLPQALDLETAVAEREAEVAAAARAVADSARRIPEAAESSPEAPTPEAARAFAALARELESRARALADAAEAPGVRQAVLQARLEALQAVCDRCHARFRLPR